jgi:hypothetical protein
MLAHSHPLALIAILFIGSGCVPGQYTTIPLPAGSKIKQQTAAADGDQNQNPNTNSPTQGSNTPNPNGNPPVGGTPSSSSGITFGPGVPERDALSKCLNLWGTAPFKEVKADQVKVMDVSVGVGGGLLAGGLAGIGNIINIGNPKDLDVTSTPRLVVLPLSVNIGGATTFELMNPNGWYCMKAAVGARSTVNIKLHCNAKLAQSDLGVSLNTNPGGGSAGTPPVPVSVGINDGRTPGGQLGIMVDSNVSVVRVDSSGNANCPP